MLSMSASIRRPIFSVHSGTFTNSSTGSALNENSRFFSTPSSLNLPPSNNIFTLSHFTALAAFRSALNGTQPAPVTSSKPCISIVFSRLEVKALPSLIHTLSSIGKVAFVGTVFPKKVNFLIKSFVFIAFYFLVVFNYTSSMVKFSFISTRITSSVSVRVS